MSQVLMTLLIDGLQLPSGFVAKSPKRCLIYYRVPDDWIDGSIPESSELYVKGVTLKPERLEALYEALYGKTWRSGNSDGSQYVVIGSGTSLLNIKDSGEKPWLLDDPGNTLLEYFHFTAGTDGQFVRIPAAEL